MATNRRDENTMTVAQVIEQLQKLPADMKVWADGCDCVNPVKAISAWDGQVLLEVEL